MLFATLGMALLALLGIRGVQAASPAPLTSAESDAAAPYTYSEPSRDGIGKIYLGREISKVMGHEGAAWLDRPERQREERSDLVLAHLDLVLMVDAYHEFSHPLEMMRGIIAALKPGGRVVLVEYRAEDPDVLIKPLHKMTRKQIEKEMAAVGLVLVRTENELPQQHLLTFGLAGR